MHAILVFLSSVGLIIEDNVRGRENFTIEKKIHSKLSMVGVWLCVISSTHLTLLHSEGPKLHAILVFLSAVGLIIEDNVRGQKTSPLRRKFIVNLER